MLQPQQDRPLRQIAVLLLFALSQRLAFASHGIPLTEVARTGQPAPGLSGVTFNTLSDVFLNESGQVVFWAGLAGTGLTDDNNTSIWIRPNGGPPVLAYRVSLPAPDGLGTVSGLGSPAIGGSGSLSFSARVYTTSKWTPTALALAAETPALSLLTREVEGTPSVPLICPANDTGFGFARAWTSATPTDVSVSTPRGVYTPATPVPGGNAGDVFREFSQPGLNASGAAVFRASVGPTPTEPPPWRFGLFSDRAVTPSVIDKVAFVGDLAAGFGNGAEFSDLGIEPAIAANGSIAFWAKAAGGGLTPGTDTGLWRSPMPEVPGGASVVIPVALAGQAAPGAGGATYSRFIHRAAIADDGTIVFSALLAGAPSGQTSGLWRAASDGSVAPLALAGREFSADLAGVTFRLFHEARVNGVGRAAFVAMLAGPGVAPTSNRALFVEGAARQLIVVVRTGDILITSDGTPRTVRAIDFDDQGVGSGRCAFNTSGSIVFRLQFEDGSDGLFVGTIPCPADFDGSGGTPDTTDIDAFFAAWLAGEPAADVDGSGGTPDLSDITFFFELWLAGGC